MRKLTEIEKRCLAVSCFPNGYQMYDNIQTKTAEALKRLGLVDIDFTENPMGRVFAIRQSQSETEEGR